ncbi:MAG: DUF456 domain-containing protein [Chloroflexi bacterium]|nr:DUF456 domain-containing protein [Chloroflexota bacterium]
MVDWNSVGTFTLQVITFAAMLGGLFSLVVVVIPGLTIIWAAALVYGLVTGFTWQSGVLFAFITILMLVGNVIDNILMGAGARSQGASWLGIGVALVAAVAGSLLVPPFGGLVAALLALFVVEVIRVRDWRKALDSTRSMALGCGWSVAARMGIGGMMIGWWLVWALVLPQIG